MAPQGLGGVQDGWVLIPETLHKRTNAAADVVIDPEHVGVRKSFKPGGGCSHEEAQLCGVRGHLQEVERHYRDEYGAVLSIIGEGAVEQVEITATVGLQVSTR